MFSSQHMPLTLTCNLQIKRAENCR